MTKKKTKMKFSVCIVFVISSCSVMLCESVGEDVSVKYSDIPVFDDNGTNVTNIATQNEIFKDLESLSKGFRTHVNVSVLIDVDTEKQEYHLRIGHIIDFTQLSLGAICFLLLLLIVPIVTSVVLYSYVTKENIIKPGWCGITTLIILIVVTLIGIIFAFISNSAIQNSIQNVDENLTGNINKTILFFNKTEEQLESLFRTNYHEFYKKQYNLVEKYQEIKNETDKFKPLLTNHEGLFQSLDKIHHATNLVCLLSPIVNKLHLSSSKWNELIKMNLNKSINNADVMDEVANFRTTINVDNILSLDELCTKLGLIPSMDLQRNFNNRLQDVIKEFYNKNNVTKSNIDKLKKDIFTDHENHSKKFNSFIKTFRNKRDSFYKRVTNQEKIDINQLRENGDFCNSMIITITVLIIVGFGFILLSIPFIRIGKILFIGGIIIFLVLELSLIISITKSFISWYIPQNSICDLPVDEPMELVQFVDQIYKMDNKSQSIFNACKQNQSYYNVFGPKDDLNELTKTSQLYNAYFNVKFSYKDFQLLDSTMINEFDTLLMNISSISDNTPILKLDTVKDELLVINNIFQNETNNLIKYFNAAELKYNGTDLEFEILGLKAKISKMADRFSTILNTSGALIYIEEILALDFDTCHDKIKTVITSIRQNQDNEVKNDSSLLMKKLDDYRRLTDTLSANYTERAKYYITNVIGTCDLLYSNYENAMTNCEVILPPLNSFWIWLMWVLVFIFVFVISLRCVVAINKTVSDEDAELEENPYYELQPLNESFNQPHQSKHSLLDIVDSSGSTTPTPLTPPTGNSNLYAGTSWVFEDLTNNSQMHKEKPPPYSEYEIPRDIRFSTVSTGTFRRTPKKNFQKSLPEIQ